MVAIVIALACLVVAGLLIRTEWADTQDAGGPRRDQLAHRLREITRTMRDRLTTTGSRDVESPRADDPHRWPPVPAAPLQEEAAIRHTAEIGAWGSAWLAESHGSDSLR